MEKYLKEVQNDAAYYGLNTVARAANRALIKLAKIYRHQTRKLIKNATSIRDYAQRRRDEKGNI